MEEKSKTEAINREALDQFLSNREDVLGTIFNTLRDAVFLVTSDRKLLKFNDAATRIFGYSQDELFSLSTEALHVDKAHYKEFGRRINDAFQKNEVAFFEFEAKRKSGEIFPSEHTVTQIKDQEGEVLGILSVVRDISVRKQAGMALVQSRDFLRQAQEIAHLGSWVLNLDDNSLTWSDEVYRIFGFQPQEFQPSYEAFLKNIHPDDRLAVNKAYLTSLQEKRDTYEIEHRIIRRKSGEVRYVHEKCEHFRDQDGKIIRSVGMVHDITERKRREKEIDQLNTDLEARAGELEDANRELEAFNYTVAHDLRKPLTVINGYSEVLIELCDNLDEQAIKYLREIEDGTLRMSQLIEALLDFSRLSHAEICRDKVDLSALAQKAVAELKQDEPERRVKIRNEEGILVNGDVSLLWVVMNNLVGNAWKYTGIREEAIIEIGTTLIDGITTCFVRDNGTGFDLADAKNLFVPFQRLKGAEDTRGLGIGLASVERIIRRHGGRVWAESELGKGTTFYFTLGI